MDFPKKQAQRLMPLYLLEYSEKLFTNHPNPEDPWGGGNDYTAGQGITITNNEISVDTNVIATKSDIAQMVTTTQLNDALDDYALKTEIPTDVSQLTNDAGYATQTWVQNQGYATSSEIPTNYVTTDTAQTITGLKTIGQTDGTISEVDFSGFTFKLSNKAINHPEADIRIRNGSYDGYQHPIISSTKGLYVNLAKIRLGDDGNNTYGITMPDSSTWEADRVLATTNDIPTKTSELQNDSGYTTQTWVETQGYSKFSGSYNDLTDKPTIPDTSKFVTTDTAQTITGAKTFQGGLITEDTTFNMKMNVVPDGFIYTDTFSDGTTHRTIFHLPTEKDTGTLEAPRMYTIATIDDYPIYDPHDQLFVSLTGEENTFYENVDLSDAPGRMFYVNLSALNPVFKDGLTSTYNEQTHQLEVGLNAPIPDKTSDLINDSGYVTSSSLATVATTGSYNDLTDKPTFATVATSGNYNDLTNKPSIPSNATSTSTSTVTPTTGTFVTGTSTNTTNVVNSVTYTPSSETLTFTYADNTTASFTFLTSNTTVTSGTTSVVSSVTDSTSTAMTDATVSTSTTTTLS